MASAEDHVEKSKKKLGVDSFSVNYFTKILIWDDCKLVQFYRLFGSQMVILVDIDMKHDYIIYLM